MPIKGLELHTKRLKNLSGPAVELAIGRVVYVGADMVRAEAFRLVSSGSIEGKAHVASKPGEAPNRDKGNLQDNFKSDKTGPLSAEFRSEAEYAAALEFGTSKMAARPHVRTARDNKRKDIVRLFEVEVDKLVKGSK